MNIIKVEPTSLVDWPGEVSSVFFVTGCNMRCSWCFNKSLVPFDLNERRVYSIEETLKLVPKHIEHIVLTGGEIFAQEGVIETIHLLKKKGFKVCVHTNGSFPELLEQVIYSLDYVAMDIKGVLNKYPMRTGVNGMSDKVFDSIVLITDKGFPHEFRTTVIPGMQANELYDIAELLSKLNAHAYYLQTYKEVRDKPKNDYLSTEELQEIAKDLPIETKVR